MRSLVSSIVFIGIGLAVPTIEELRQQSYFYVLLALWVAGACYASWPTIVELIHPSHRARMSAIRRKERQEKDRDIALIRSVQRHPLLGTILPIPIDPDKPVVTAPVVVPHRVRVRKWSIRRVVWLANHRILPEIGLRWVTSLLGSSFPIRHRQA